MKERFYWYAAAAGLFCGYIIGVTQPCQLWPASNFCTCEQKCECKNCVCDPCECSKCECTQDLET